MRPPPKRECGEEEEETLSQTDLLNPFSLPSQKRALQKWKIERKKGGGKFLKKEGVSARFPKKGRRKQDWVCAQNSSQNIFSELFDEGSGGGVLHIFGTNLDS